MRQKKCKENLTFSIQRLLFLSTSFCPPPPFLLSFRVICQHFANIPEVRGHAFHHGQDPSPWSSSSTVLYMLRVKYALILSAHSSVAQCLIFVFFVCFFTVYYLFISSLYCFFFFRPEGTRMIQIMLLKSLVQVCGWRCIRWRKFKWQKR